jgi:WD40 repeat protein
MIGSSGTDGIIKVWNMYDMEHCLNFIVPKEECLSIAMHQFKPYMVCSFSDGYIRFFDLQDSRNLGRCKVMSPNEEADPAAESDVADPLDYVVSIKILPSGQHMLCATKNGQIFLIFVENWAPLAIQITNLVSLNTAVHSFDVSFLEPYNKWLVGTANGKVIVYNRQDCNSFKQELFDRAKPPNFIFMDSFNVQEYVDNCFTEAKRVNTLDHYYSLAKRNLVYNEVAAENETHGIFLNNDLASHISYVRKSNNLFIRNFELHQVVKRI